jgi:spore coat protein A
MQVKFILTHRPALLTVPRGPGHERRKALRTRNRSLHRTIALGAMILGMVMATMGPAVAQLPTIVDPLYSQPILDPVAIPKYVTALPNPLTPGFVLAPDTLAYPGYDYYEISQRPIVWQILPAGFPATDVWAYGDPNDPGTFSYPGHTVIARSTYGPVDGSGLGKPAKIQYFNELPLTHLLPIDRHVHGTEMGEPDVRTIVHLHGGKNVGPASDGYAEAWVTPDGNTIEDYLAPEDLPELYTPYNPNPFDYPNSQEAAQLWFHDHALGATRLNVYAGLAALYTLRDDNEEFLVENGNLPVYPYEVPVVIQDRTFYPDGSLAYPDVEAPTLPDFEPWPGGPSIQPEFFGEAIVVNGVTWPYLEVEPRKYRVRFLNGSGSRFYDLFLSTGQSFYVIGMEGGLLPSPVPRTRLTIGPAERLDCVIDFAPFVGQRIALRNNARSPFPKGATANPNTSGQIMQFSVTAPLSDVPDVTLPADLRPIAGPIPGLVATNTRSVLLFEGVDGFGRLQPLLGTPAAGALNWFAPITENPMVGDVEVWEIYNTTEDAHPIHIHEILFQVVNRQKFTGIQDPETGALTNIKLKGQPALPGLYERGQKETVIAYPGEVTRIIARFETAGLFAWHCHIIEHEDHEMMRPYHIGPLPPLALAKGGSEEAVGAGDAPVAARSALRQNIPNPFNPVTDIRFELGEDGPVSLQVYNTSGEIVQTLVDGPLGAGPHGVRWDGTDRNGLKVSSGVYFYRLVAGTFAETKKMSLLR